MASKFSHPTTSGQGRKLNHVVERSLPATGQPLRSYLGLPSTLLYQGSCIAFCGVHSGQADKVVGRKALHLPQYIRSCRLISYVPSHLQLHALVLRLLPLSVHTCI
jgi:hypothetical protein